MVNKTDKVIQVRLYSPHKCDFIYEREDGTRYIHRKLDEEAFYELHRVSEDSTDWSIGEKIEQ